MKPEHSPYNADDMARKGWAILSNEEAQALQKRFGQYMATQYPIGSNSRSIRGSTWKWAAAAAILVLFVAVYWMQSSRSTGWPDEDLALRRPPQKSLPSALLAVQRDAQGIGRSVLSEAMEAYEKERFEQAVPLFEQAIAAGLDQEYPEILLYYGHAQMFSVPEKATETLQRVARMPSVSQVQKDVADWLRANALLVIGKKQQGLILLELIAQSNSVCQEDAAKLLKRIEED